MSLAFRRCKIFGAGQYAMRIWVRPDQLAKLNITVPEIINAVSSQNNVNPAGKLGGTAQPAGRRFHLHRARTRPPHLGRGVWEHRCSRHCRMARSFG